MKKHIVHNLIILDESGSMSSIKEQIISGFNETVQSIRNAQKKYTDQEHFITLVTFNGTGRKVLHFCSPVTDLKEIDGNLYQPDDMTPLFDAIGFSVTRLKKEIDKKTEYNVLVTILTDGEENASAEYRGEDIRKIISKLKSKNWTFTYIGTDHDVEAVAVKLAITNTLIFQKDSAGIDKMFLKESNSRAKYYARINSKENTENNFFEE